MNSIKIKKSILVAAIALAGFATQAQVKVGLNPTVIAADANLDVEATDGSRVVVKKANGRIGVGTIDPQSTVDVRGTGYFGNGTLGTMLGQAGYSFINSVGANNPLTLNYNNGQATSINFTSSANVDIVAGGTGKVGIGTLTPTTKLTVEDNEDTYVRVNAPMAKQSGFVISAGSPDPTWSIYRPLNTYDLSFWNPTRGSTLYMTQDGKVGISRSVAPSHKLTIGEGGVDATLPNSRITSVMVGPDGDCGLGFSNTGGAAGLYQLQASGLFAGTTTNHPMYFRTNDVDRGVIDAAGNFGVGTLSPTQKLDVRGAGLYSNDGVLGVQIGQAAYGYISSVGANNPLSLNYNNNLPTSINFTSSANVDLVAGGTGLVGIGTNVPTQKLDVIGQVAIRDGGVNGLLMGQGAYAGIASTGGGNPLVLNYNNNQTTSLNFASSANVDMVAGGTGLVGIGTNLPTDKLTVESNEDAFVRVNSPYTKQNGFVISSGSAAVDWSIYRPLNTRDLSFWNTTIGSTMYMTQAGNVGIGTSIPNAPLQFANNALNRKIVMYEQANNDNEYYGFGINNNELRYQVVAGASHVFWASNSSSSSTELMRINGNDGNVGIGIAAPSERLHVVGNILASGTITPSDARFKENVATLSGSMSKLAQLRGVSYTHKAEFIKDRGLKEGNQIGFIAQELEQIFPEFVVTSKDGYKAVDYARLTPVLVESLKEVNAKLEAQQSEINELKAAVKQLMEKK
jgi:hypothetical protein